MFNFYNFLVNTLDNFFLNYFQSLETTTKPTTTEPTTEPTTETTTATTEEPLTEETLDRKTEISDTTILRFLAWLMGKDYKVYNEVLLRIPSLKEAIKEKQTIDKLGDYEKVKSDLELVKRILPDTAILVPLDQIRKAWSKGSGERAKTLTKELVEYLQLIKKEIRTLSSSSGLNKETLKDVNKQFVSILYELDKIKEIKEDTEDKGGIFTEVFEKIKEPTTKLIYYTIEIALELNEKGKEIEVEKKDLSSIAELRRGGKTTKDILELISKEKMLMK